jgi:hypothetical protein
VHDALLSPPPNPPARAQSVVRLLLDAGANARQRNKAGRLPSDVVSKSKYPQVCVCVCVCVCARALAHPQHMTRCRSAPIS